MKKIGIIMGSDSDLPVVEKAINTLKEYGVPFEVHVYSAHRTPTEAAAFVSGAKDAEAIFHVYGMRNGIEGLLDERIVSLDEFASDNDKLMLLAQTPASALGSCRKKLPDPNSELEKDVKIYKCIFEIFEKYDVEVKIL